MSINEATIERSIQAYLQTGSLREAGYANGISHKSVAKYCRLRGVPITSYPPTHPLYTQKSREQSPTWKGGRWIDEQGYVQVFAKDHPWPRNHPYLREHIVVMERHIGRRLKRGEVVHHRDHNRANNDLENLQLMTNAEHLSLHHLGAKRPRKQQVERIADDHARRPGGRDLAITGIRRGVA